VKRKDELLIYSLGRVTNPYKAAQTYLRNTRPKRSLALGEVGPWYTCKKQLLREGLIRQSNGKNKSIEANLPKYFGVLLENSPHKKDLENENIPLFKKYASRIVDFLIKNDSLEKTHDFSYPLVFFLFARYLASIDDPIHKLPVSAKMGEVQTFVDSLSISEKKEFAIALENQKQLHTVLEGAFDILPPEAFREIFMELDMKVLAEITFRKKMLDRLVYWIADSPARAQVLIDAMNEYDRRQIEETAIEEQEEQDRILREQQATDA
jgi:hypothetical protein